MRSNMKDSPKGVAAVFLAYIIWGAMPFYWKALISVDSLEILGHRIVWSFLFTLLLILLTSETGRMIRFVRQNPRTLPLLAVSGILVACNWYIYIWAVNHGQILATSLGYFINPLVTMLFGVAVFRERLRPVQWLAIAIATGGVAVEIVALGRLPLVSLGLAATFALYGLMKKKIQVDAASGLFLETTVLLLPALLLLFRLQQAGTAHYPYALSINLLLVGTGILTSSALILFAWGLKTVRLTTSGLIQYTSPTMTFLIALLAYGEPMSRMRTLSFSLIWIGLAVYTFEGVYRRGRAEA